MKALFLILASLVGAFIYRYFFDDAKHLEYIAEQAHWQFITLIMLWSMDCLKKST